MPCDFLIDVDRHIVRTTIRGAVTREEVLAFRARLVSDPAFAPDLALLLDVRDTNSEALTSLDIRALAETSMTHPGVRRAIVATDAAAIGLARLFGTYRELKEGQQDTAVFTTFESAERWLTEPAVTVTPAAPDLFPAHQEGTEDAATRMRSTNPPR